jgi:hypothetical protein
MSSVSSLYGKKASGKITFEQPDTYNRFPDSLQQRVVQWLSGK